MDKDELESLYILRHLSNSFLDGSLEIAEFLDKMGVELGSAFDYGVDIKKEHLPDYFTDFIKDEITFYHSITNIHPENQELQAVINSWWEYAVSKERYGWVNATAYRELYEKAYKKLVLEPLK